ncbi:MAG: hypothetical protein ACRCXD_00055 [Luteolibacter sp.]
MSTALEVRESFSPIQVLERLPERAAYADQVRKSTRGLVKDLARTYWALAESFGFILEKRLYLDWGYETFEQYAEAECDMKRNKALGLAKIHNYFTREIAPAFEENPKLYEEVIDTAKEMGWVKALRLATTRVMTAENAPLVLEQARTLSSEQLDMAIRMSIAAEQKKKKLESGEPLVRKTQEQSVRRPFSLTMDQAEKVEDGIRKALLVLPQGADENAAVSHICESYFNEQCVSIEDVLVDLENRFGVCLVAFDQDYARVLYGEGTLEEFKDANGG